MPGWRRRHSGSEFPTGIAGASWFCWALVNFERTDYLDASPGAGIIGLSGVLGGLVCPIVCGVFLAKERSEESAIPEKVQGAIGAFAGTVFLWTVLYVFMMLKYMTAV